MCKYSFIVPAFNEEKNIPLLIQKITDLMDRIKDSWEIIFINDGSTDNTLQEIKHFAEKIKNIKFLDLSRNFGHQNALSAGLLYAKGDAIISMDCDLQDPPEVIEDMITKWKDGYDIVYARRRNYRKDSFVKRTLSKLYYKILDVFTDIKIPQNVGDFRLIDKNVLKIINKMPEKSRYLRGMVAWAGFKFTFVDYFRPDRQEGVSHYSLRKLFGLAMSGMINFSFLPLRFGFVLGIISILTGGFLLTWQIVDYLINNAYYHLYKWIIVVLFMFMGFMFMLIWMIGEYIGKIYDEVRSRPIFIVKETGNINDTQENNLKKQTNEE